MHGDKRIIEFTVEVIVEPDDGGFHAYCPALKGLHTCGNTEEEALQNAGDAAIAYLESSINHGDLIPVGVQMREEFEGMHPTHVSPANYRKEDLKVTCAIS